MIRDSCPHKCDLFITLLEHTWHYLKFESLSLFLTSCWLSFLPFWNVQTWVQMLKFFKKECKRLKQRHCWFQLANSIELVWMNNKIAQITIGFNICSWSIAWNTLDNDYNTEYAINELLLHLPLILHQIELIRTLWWTIQNQRTFTALYLSLFFYFHLSSTFFSSSLLLDVPFFSQFFLLCFYRLQSIFLYYITKINAHLFKQ